MEHIVVFVRVAPIVQILDAPVPQMVEQLQDILRFFDTLLPVPEQAVEVPKIFLDDVPMRAVLRDPQPAEQLVEVPTIVPIPWLQLRMEQNVAYVFPVHPPRCTLQLVFMETWMSLVTGFFALFPNFFFKKKVRRWVGGRGRN